MNQARRDRLNMMMKVGRAMQIVRRRLDISADGASHRVIADALADSLGLPRKQTKDARRALVLEHVGESTDVLRPRPARTVGFGDPVIDPRGDDFLKSYEWRKLRMVVITKRGARCECCGSTPRDGVRINVDHIKPRRLFPELALVESNLQVLCADCNHGKGNWDQTDWRSPQATTDLVN